MKFNLVRVSIFCAIVCAPLVASATFIPSNGFVFDSLHQHPSDDVTVWNNYEVSMVDGGLIGSTLNIYDTATFDMYGGTVGSTVTAENSSILNIRGGTISSFVDAIGTTATVNIYGAVIQSYIDSHHSTINIYGGSFTSLQETFAGVINIYGTNLRYASGRVTGTLANGQTLNASYFQLGDPGQLNLITVPEPSTLILAACGAGGLLLARRHFSHR